jgi:hypothetical protein
MRFFSISFELWKLLSFLATVGDLPPAHRFVSANTYGETALSGRLTTLRLQDDFAPGSAPEDRRTGGASPR